MQPSETQSYTHMCLRGEYKYKDLKPQLLFLFLIDVFYIYMPFSSLAPNSSLSVSLFFIFFSAILEQSHSPRIYLSLCQPCTHIYLPPVAPLQLVVLLPFVHRSHLHSVLHNALCKFVLGVITVTSTFLWISGKCFHCNKGILRNVFPS